MQRGQRFTLARLQVSTGEVVLGAHAVTFSLVLFLSPRGHLSLFRQCLRQLRAQVHQRLALASLQVAEGSLVLSDRAVPFAFVLLLARGQAALLGERLG